MLSDPKIGEKSHPRERFASMAKRVAAIDFGSSGIKIAVGTPTDDGAKVEKTLLIETPRGLIRDGAVKNSKELADFLREVWSKNRLPKNVIVGITSPKVDCRPFVIDYVEPKALEASYRGLLPEKVALPSSNWSLDYLIEEVLAPQDLHGQKLLKGLLLAIPEKDVSDYLSAVVGASLRPVGVELSALALLRAARLGSDRESGVILEIGRDVLTMIVHRGRSLRHIEAVFGHGGGEATGKVRAILGEYGEEVKYERAAENRKRNDTGSESVAGALASYSRGVADFLVRTLVDNGALRGESYSRVLLGGGGGLVAGLPDAIAHATKGSDTPGLSSGPVVLDTDRYVLEEGVDQEDIESGASFVAAIGLLSSRGEKR